MSTEILGTRPEAVHSGNGSQEAERGAKLPPQQPHHGAPRGAGGGGMHQGPGKFLLLLAPKPTQERLKCWQSGGTELWWNSNRIGLTALPLRCLPLSALRLQKARPGRPCALVPGGRRFWPGAQKRSLRRRSAQSLQLCLAAPDTAQQRLP